MPGKQYRALNLRVAALGISILVLFFLIMGLIKLGAPWSMATADVVLQEDTLLKKANELYPGLDLGGGQLKAPDRLKANVEWLRSTEAMQSVLESLPPGQISMFAEPGDGWVARATERLRGWTCGGGILHWLGKDKDGCLWLADDSTLKVTTKKLDLAKERFSLALSEDERRLSIGFRSADPDLSIGMVTALGKALVARQEEAKQALRRRVNEWIETERTRTPEQLAEKAEQRDEEENDLGDSQAEIRLFQKVAEAMKDADEDLNRLLSFKQEEAAQTKWRTPGFGTAPSIEADPSSEKAIDRQIDKARRDRTALSHELASMTAAFKNGEWKGYQDLLPSPEPEVAEAEQRAYAALTKSQYSFLIHPDWAKPAAVLRQSVGATGLTTLMTVALALPLAIAIGLALAFAVITIQNRTKPHVDEEVSLYANPHWPNLRSPQS